jgi:pimeloyl-ACP methyl ester carboxylesterase
MIPMTRSPSRSRPRRGWPLAALVSLLLLMTATLPACKPPARRAFAELTYPEPVQHTLTLQVGSATVAYTDHGQGEETLVLIHGLGSYLPAWKNNVGALARGRRVIAIDLPGYGKSSKSDDYAYSMAFFATIVQGVIDELGLHQPVLVGHSMGAQIAMTHALRYPGKARALVLASPAGLETFEDGEAQWLADAVTDDFTCKATPEAIWSRTTQNFHHMPKDARFMATDRVEVIGGPDFPQYCRAVSRSVRAMLDEPVYARLPEVDVPVLVVFGKYDQLIPNPFMHGGSTERLAKKTVPRLPRAELVMLPRAGHMAQFEQAEAWNDAVLAFLAKLPPRSQPPVEEPTDAPTTDEPTTDEATTDVTTTDGSAADEPTTDEPTTDVPAADDPRRKLPPIAAPAPTDPSAAPGEPLEPAEGGPT